MSKKSPKEKKTKNDQHLDKLLEIMLSSSAHPLKSLTTADPRPLMTFARVVVQQFERYAKKEGFDGWDFLKEDISNRITGMAAQDNTKSAPSINKLFIRLILPLFIGGYKQQALKLELAHHRELIAEEHNLYMQKTSLVSFVHPTQYHLLNVFLRDEYKSLREKGVALKKHKRGYLLYVKKKELNFSLPYKESNRRHFINITKLDILLGKIKGDDKLLLSAIITSIRNAYIDKVNGADGCVDDISLSHMRDSLLATIAKSIESKRKPDAEESLIPTNEVSDKDNINALQHLYPAPEGIDYTPGSDGEPNTSKVTKKQIPYKGKTLDYIAKKIEEKSESEKTKDFLFDKLANEDGEFAEETEKSVESVITFLGRLSQNARSADLSGQHQKNITKAYVLVGNQGHLLQSIFGPDLVKSIGNEALKTYILPPPPACLLKDKPNDHGQPVVDFILSLEKKKSLLKKKVQSNPARLKQDLKVFQIKTAIKHLLLHFMLSKEGQINVVNAQQAIARAIDEICILNPDDKHIKILKNITENLGELTSTALPIKYPYEDFIEKNRFQIARLSDSPCSIDDECKPENNVFLRHDEAIELFLNLNSKEHIYYGVEGVPSSTWILNHINKLYLTPGFIEGTLDESSKELAFEIKCKLFVAFSESYKLKLQELNSSLLAISPKSLPEKQHTFYRLSNEFKRSPLIISGLLLTTGFLATGGAITSAFLISLAATWVMPLAVGILAVAAIAAFLVGGIIKIRDNFKHNSTAREKYSSINAQLSLIAAQPESTFLHTQTTNTSTPTEQNQGDSSDESLDSEQSGAPSQFTGYELLSNPFAKSAAQVSRHRGISWGKNSRSTKALAKKFKQAIDLGAETDSSEEAKKNAAIAKEAMYHLVRVVLENKQDLPPFLQYLAGNSTHAKAVSFSGNAEQVKINDLATLIHIVGSIYQNETEKDLPEHDNSL